ncbi:MAG: hypothetical protein KFH98_13390 [Gemmatimonadetes bacterium]|nr:hypothetical protein [Gemmatimonadota bacterium]
MRRMWLAVMLVSVGCADEIPEDVSAHMEAARTANQAVADSVAAPDIAALIAGAPAGGHADWVRDIRTGLDTVAASAGVDRGEALYTVQELYSRRYDPLRQFYGTDGAAGPGQQLAQAVERAGMQLRELMRHLAGDASDGDVIEANVRAVQDALDQIESASQAAGLPPTAPRDVITTGS